ncbi:MAG TPA: ferredoxin reductase family protein [Gammaproteobacteria bacterium]
MHFKTWHAIGLIAAVSLAVTMHEVTRDTRFTLEALSLAAGVTALSLMGAAALLGGRFGFVESLFGGLDRVYIAHKWLGIWALGFASFHFAFAAEHDAWITMPIVELPRFVTRLVRQLSFLALMLIVLLALNRKIRYGVWRWWHKLSGPLFLIVILHWLSFRSPIALAEPAGIWLAAMSALGVAGAGYKLLLYPFVARHGRYRVVGVSPGPSAMHLELEPVQRPIAFKPGQFGFLRMKEDGLREPHPFTIAAGGDGDGRVHFVIRALGDYTRELVARTVPGMHAEIYGPYGRFERRPAAREVWIAGGVGITPFISWLTDPNAERFGDVTLFYFFTPGREFPSGEIIRGLAEERGAACVPVAGEPSSPEFVERLGRIAAAGDPADVVVSFCGPAGLLDAVRERVRAAGIPDASLRHEHVEFR